MCKSFLFIFIVYISSLSSCTHSKKKTSSFRNLASNFEPKYCNIDKKTTRVIKLLEETRDQNNVWPGFNLEEVRVVLTDGKFNDRPLLINYQQDLLNSVNLVAYICLGYNSVLWAPNRHIRKRTSDLILQCSTDQTEKWAEESRCDFFPELQELYKKYKLASYFYRVPTQLTKKFFNEKLGDHKKVDDYTLISQAQTVIHEDFHSYQDKNEFIFKNLPNNVDQNIDYYEHCLTNQPWTLELKKEQESLAEILKKIKSFDKLGLKVNLEKILRQRTSSSNPACWNKHRFYERWEGVAEYVSTVTFLNKGKIDWEYLIALHGIHILSDISYYSSGMLLGIALDLLYQNSNWKNKVNQGYFLDYLLLHPELLE